MKKIQLNGKKLNLGKQKITDLCTVVGGIQKLFTDKKECIPALIDSKICGNFDTKLVSEETTIPKQTTRCTF